MGRFYRNTGAPFTSEVGQKVRTGQVFEPTDMDLAQRGFKLQETEDAVGTVDPEAGWTFPGFASSQAEQLAEHRELELRAFHGMEGSGQDGKFTLSDVREAVNFEEQIDAQTEQVQAELDADEGSG